MGKKADVRVFVSSAPWRGQLTEIEAADVADAESHYAQYGVDSHRRLALIAKMAAMLDEGSVRSEEIIQEEMNNG